ncbi:hypothetical protein B0H10DRAFT_2179659 [Mycena sp. CBHHK59/15]|nr:hypothetical protein B0H10DRAFT_2179659 [Mycena sp. CBHHK59/15]
MAGFPRSCFSEKELNATRWYAKKNGVSGQPTIRQVKNHRPDILNVAGVSTTLINGQLGNVFAINDWLKIIEHEFANPLVRPHLHLYPEDSGKRLEEARQGAKWKDEVDGNLSAPMARAENGKDYFVEEPALANIDDDGTIGPVMPMRWFTRNGNAYVIDGTLQGCLELPLTAFFLTAVDLNEMGCILRDLQACDLDSWDQPIFNPWRAKGNGERVHSVPLWTYCDDTSGNVSKKWNKHNSVLFTLAGLPREYTQMLYNVHFIATSNTAPPLEMMEAVTAMLRDARRTGIRVWDCELKEFILIIPWILAFQGDNPMSSEFASHIGMQGNYFCRVCNAKSDKKSRAPGTAGEIDRLKDFMTPGVPRSKEKTVADLEQQLKRAINGAPSAVDTMATDTGSKDKYFQHFVDKLQTASTKLKEEQKMKPADGTLSKADEVKAMLHRLRDEMPENVFNPVLSILDFDPSSDSPVEILHVLLLGVVKYWWRDAVSRQTAQGKDELRTRLSSIDVAGLNSSRLRGNMYVQYAGSLVGRDFRIILQVALIVLHGLIPATHYQGWVALCKLAPLMFQPAIEDLPAYTKKLKDAVFDFLAATALWNTQWFNKPKFHLFSFNLVIRLRSVHSPRHAPSLDIGSSFGHLHAIRHLVSGGFVQTAVDGTTLLFPRQAGRHVTALIDDDEFVKFMSMDGLREGSRAGFYTSITGPCQWEETLAFERGLRSPLGSGAAIIRCRNLVLKGGDRVDVGKYIVYHLGQVSAVGRVEEILVTEQANRLLGVLVSKCRIGPDILPYHMPSCTVDSSSPLLLVFEELLCAINVAHNCAANDCKPTNTRQLLQEREATDQFEDELKHPIQPDDCFLNLSQLRSATHVQQFRSPMGLHAINNKASLEREARDNQVAKEAEKVARELEKAAREERRKAKESEKAKKLEERMWNTMPTERAGQERQVHRPEQTASTSTATSDVDRPEEQAETCKSRYIRKCTTCCVTSAPADRGRQYR